MAREPAGAVHVFGIRHHGPGSARSLERALERLAPDVVLIEGPPEADALIALAADDEMRPPVALLIYRPDVPRRAVYYPFAEFSPEWRAIRFAIGRGVPARFIDLPQGHQLIDEPEAPPPDDSAAPLTPPARDDPLGSLAAAAGYDDGETFWEQLVEHRRSDDAALFDAVASAMAELRAVPAEPDREREERREAHMRRAIRDAQREGFERIAVVCGAWHAPALSSMPAASHDAAILKALPKVKVEATWVPWTNGRLCAASGYGAGIESPGWYHHLWTAPDRVTERWLARVASLLREEDLDASSAQIIDTARLADSLAALRGRSLAGLSELMEATRAVLCSGADAPIALIARKLVVGETLGHVPATAPMVPLHQDLIREQRRLRLSPEAVERTLDLDLRKDTDLARSHLLHRLTILGVPWGRVQQASSQRGTFHELWMLQWQPVVPFEAQQSFGLDQETLGALGGGIAQILASELSLSPGGSAAPRSSTAGAITSQALAKSARIDAATAAKIGKLVGAKYVIMGNFVDYYGKFRLNVRVVDAQTGAIVKGFSNEDPKMQDRDQIYLITQTVAQKILQELKLPPAPVTTVAVPGASVIAFSLGLKAEDAGNKAQAASLYERALQSAPDFPEAKDALARVKG